MLFCAVLRCQHHVQKTASVHLTPPHVHQESVSCLMPVNAVKFVHDSSLRTVAELSHVTTRRGLSATLEEDTALLRASVEVQNLFFTHNLLLRT